jgi:hypothetical protein
MKIALLVLAGVIFSGMPAPAASAPIIDPASFVAEVYRHLIASEKTGQTYVPPEDVYTNRLAKLFRDDKKRAKGEVGCLDFDFWVNGQDWAITRLSVTKGVADQERQTVIARFLNIHTPQEIHFDFRRAAGRWLLDEVHSEKEPRWILSKILKCQP